MLFPTSCARSMAPHRAPGFLAALVAESRVTAKGFELEPDHLAELLVRFPLTERRCTQPSRKGVGDMVERVTRPLAVTLDEVFHTKLAGCSACSRRRRWLNEAGWKCRDTLEAFCSRLRSALKRPASAA